MRYMILESPDLNDLINQVNEHLKKHWQLQGGVFIFSAVIPGAKPNAIGSYSGQYCSWYAQPMVISAEYDFQRGKDAKETWAHEETAEAQV